MIAHISGGHTHRQRFGFLVARGLLVDLEIDEFLPSSLIVLIRTALSFSLERLARFTSFVALIVFLMVNASLWRLKRDDEVRPVFRVPNAVPVLGILLCSGMIVYQTMEWLLLTED